MATIYERAGKWRAQVRLAGHRPITKTFAKKILAEQWVKETEKSLRAGMPVSDGDIGDLFQRYIDEILPLKPMQRTHVATLRSLRRKLTRVEVSEINPAWMLKFANGETVAPSTRGQLFVFIGMVLRTADTFWDVRVDWEQWERGRKMLKHYGLIARSTERNRRVSDDEIEQVMDHMQSSLPMDDLIAFAVDSCMRLGEIVRVTWADLDEAKRLLTIRDRKHPKYKLGNHQTIPLLGRSYEIAATQPKFCATIFPYEAGSISAAFHRAVVRAGIDDMRWHDLRHEGISRLFERGLGIEQVSLVSGHRDWGMLRRYTHLKPESLHDLVR